MGEYRINRPDPAAMERALAGEGDSPAGLILRLAWRQGLTREEISCLQWDQVSFPDSQLLLPDRTVPLEPDTAACLQRRWEQAGAASPYVVTSARRTQMPPESVSRLARQALDREGQTAVRLMDLRHDFVLRMMETHDWPYVVRVSGMTVSTLQTRYARAPQPETAPLNLGAARKAEIDEFKLWKLMQQEGSSPAGLALWLTWQMGLQAQEILALTWSQVDFAAGEVRLPDRAVPLTNAVRRLLQGELARRQPGDDPHVLLTPNSRRPMDLPRLSRLVRTALIRGGMESVTLRDLRRDESREDTDARILDAAARRGCLSRSQVMALLGLSRSAAYNRLRSLTERGRLVLVGEKYYPAGTVVPPDQQREAVCQYLRENGTAYRQDIAGLLRIGQRQCTALLRRMVAEGLLRQEKQRYSLPEDFFVP